MTIPDRQFCCRAASFLLPPVIDFEEGGSLWINPTQLPDPPSTSLGGLFIQVDHELKLEFINRIRASQDADSTTEYTSKCLIANTAIVSYSLILLWSTQLRQNLLWKVSSARFDQKFYETIRILSPNLVALWYCLDPNSFIQSDRNAFLGSAITFELAENIQKSFQ